MYILTVRYANYFDGDKVTTISYLFDNKTDAVNMYDVYCNCANVTMCFVMDTITGENVA